MSAIFKIGDRVKPLESLKELDREIYDEFYPSVIITNVVMGDDRYNVDSYSYYYIRQDNGRESSFSNEEIVELVASKNWREKMLE